MIRIAAKGAELCCIIGNLFEGLEPPCDEIVPTDGLLIRGRSWSGKECSVKVHKSYAEFEGDSSDINAVLSGKCPEKRCNRNGNE